MDTLRSAIEHLYDVFASYASPPDLGRCKHGLPTDLQSFLMTPLRSLSVDDLALAHFSWEALTTWGTVDDFKHFLPRLFEIAAFDKYRYDPEVLFGKITRANWRSWPKREQNAIEAYCRALWEHALMTYPVSKALPSFVEIDDCLCSIARATGDIEPFLQRWQQSCLVAVDHLADFALANAQSLPTEKRLVNAFWRDIPEQERTVVNWLSTPMVSALLEGNDIRRVEARRVLLALQNSTVAG